MVDHQLSGGKEIVSILGFDQFQWTCEPVDPDVICRRERGDGGSAAGEDDRCEF